MPTSVIAVNAFTTGSPTRGPDSTIRCAGDGHDRSRIPATARPRGAGGVAGRVGLAVGAPLVLAGCNVYPTYGASRGATKQGQETFKLYSGMMTTGIIVGGLVGLLILWTIIRYRKRSDEMPRQFHENVPIEILYTVIPVIIVGVPVRLHRPHREQRRRHPCRSTPPSPPPGSRWSTSR